MEENFFNEADNFISNDLLILVYRLFARERESRKSEFFIMIDICLFEAYLLDNNCHLEEK